MIKFPPTFESLLNIGQKEHPVTVLGIYLTRTESHFDASSTSAIQRILLGIVMIHLVNKKSSAG